MSKTVKDPRFGNERAIHRRQGALGEESGKNDTEKPVSPPHEGKFPLLLEQRRINEVVASNSFRSFGINE